MSTYTVRVRFRWHLSSCQIKTLKSVQPEKAQKRLVEDATTRFRSILTAAWEAREKVLKSLSNQKLIEKNGAVFTSVNKEEGDSGDALRTIELTGDFSERGTEARRQMEQQLKTAIISEILIQMSGPVHHSGGPGKLLRRARRM